MGVHAWKYVAETGWYYLNSRYYDPEVKRFINADSEISGANDQITGKNLFAYCFNNPVMLTDETGSWPSLGQIFQAAVGVAVAAVAVAAVVTAGPVLAAAVGYTSGVIAAGATLATATVAAGCGGGMVAEAVTGVNPIKEAVGDEAFDVITTVSTAGAIQGNISSFVGPSVGSSSQGRSSSSKLEKYIRNPQSIKNVSPSKIQKIAAKEGLSTGVLMDGAHAGQGFKVTFGGDRLLMYHPGGGHHGPKSYWKISSGQTGTIRIFNDK